MIFLRDVLKRKLQFKLFNLNPRVVATSKKKKTQRTKKNQIMTKKKKKKRRAKSLNHS